MNKVFEVKQNGKWSKVQASSMIALNNWADQNKVSNWRMVGMMSRQEMSDSKNLPFVG